MAGAAMGLVLLLLTRSRTAFAAAAATSCLLALFSAPRGGRRMALLVGAGVIALLVLLSPEVRSAAADTVLLGRSTDTDRSPIWRDCLEYVAARPLLGYGYNAFWADVLPMLKLDSDGFEIETAMNVRALGAGLKVVEVPSFEDRRIYGEGRLRTFPDGWRVLKTIFREWLAPRRSIARPLLAEARIQRITESVDERAAVPAGLEVEV